MSAEEWRTWEGRVVDGRFPLRRWLGGSEHSAVFLTEQPGIASQRAAIKLIPADLSDSDHLLTRWRAASQLSHPHLIRIFDGGHSYIDDTPVLYEVMELAEEDLSQIIPHRPLTPAEISALLPPLLDALSYVHEKGLVHGRIKPSNVLAAGDQLKLSSDEIRPSSATNGLGAGPAESIHGRRDVYDAPETSAGIVSPAGDVWSLGVTLATALMQRVPFAGDVSHGEPGLPESIPRGLREVVRECLQLDPQRRCSIEEIQARIRPAGRVVPADAAPAADRYLATTTRTSAEPPTIGRIHSEAARSQPAGSGAARHPWRWLIPVIVLIVFVLGLRIFYRGAEQRTGQPADQSSGQIPEQTRTQSSPGNPSASSPAVSSPSIVATAPSTPTPAQPTLPPFTSVSPKKAGNTSVSGGVVRQVLPEVPQSARNTITGHVKVGVRVEVDSSGRVTATKLASPGPSHYFARLALNAAERWQFSAPQVNGQPDASAWLLVFRFGRTSTQVSPELVRR